MQHLLMRSKLTAAPVGEGATPAPASAAAPAPAAEGGDAAKEDPMRSAKPLFYAYRRVGGEAGRRMLHACASGVLGRGGACCGPVLVPV